VFFNVRYIDSILSYFNEVLHAHDAAMKNGTRMNVDLHFRHERRQRMGGDILREKENSIQSKV
jgi:hypothetical protein